MLSQSAASLETVTQDFLVERLLALRECELPHLSASPPGPFWLRYLANSSH